MASKATSPPLPFSSTAPPPPPPSLSSSPTPIVTISTSSLASTSTLSESSNDSGPEVGSLFTFEPHVLRPFMGLHNVDRPDDPWHHKAYNLYQPLYDGGGTFEHYMKRQRFKRDLDTITPFRLSTTTKDGNVLSSEVLDRLLQKKSNHKTHSTLYTSTSLLDQLGNPETTTKELPHYIFHKNLELPVAEINPLESLIYQEDLQKKKHKPQDPSESIINSYKNEHDFLGNSQGDFETITPTKGAADILQALSEKLPVITHQKISSFWHEPQSTGNQTISGSSDKPHNFWEEHLKELQLLLENSHTNLNEPSNVKYTFQDDISEPQSVWKNSQETLKALTENSVQLNRTQDTSNKEQSLRETFKELKDNTQETSINDEHILLDPSSLQKRNSFWAELEASEERKERIQQYPDVSESIFDFDEDFN